MRTLVMAVAVLTVVACSKKDETPAVDTTAAAMPAPAAPSALTVADVSGEWNVAVKNEAGDSVLTAYILSAPADTAEWTMQFTGRKDVIPTHIVAIAGDSMTLHAGPFSSAIRKSIQVTTNAVYRLVEGKLVGKVAAHYSVKTADSLRTLTAEGTKK